MSDRGDVFSPIAFTAFVAGGALIGSTICSYENGNIPPLRRRSNLDSGGPQMVRLGFEISSVDKVFWPICIINGVVFLGWRCSILLPTMVTYFTASPVSRSVCLPLILSTFSHYSFYHLVANMFVLHSFLPAAISLLGPENFVGLYITAGTVASLGSHLYKVCSGTNIPSLGASGAIMGILAYVCTKMPDIQLGIVFLPGVSFSADTAIKCIVAVDAVGLLAGWKFMDHAAHLSGALVGLGFAYFEENVQTLRDSIIKAWRSFRSER